MGLGSQLIPRIHIISMGPELIIGSRDTDKSTVAIDRIIIKTLVIEFMFEMVKRYPSKPCTALLQKSLIYDLSKLILLLLV